MAKFRLSSSESFNYASPQEMFDDYKNKNITNIYDYQSKMIDLYLEVEKGVKDIALELPTGTGKTLVGLLIGEFLRRKNKDKVLYLCSNNQLVYQTVKHAKEDYGIKATAFTGKVIDYSQQDKSNYTLAKTIAVASYSALFNCNPFFSDVDILIFDDAHSGESYVASNWTVSITLQNDAVLYEEIVDVFQNIVEPEVYDKLINADYVDNSFWYDKIPNIRLVDNYRKIRGVVNDYIKDNPYTDIRYAWSMIEEHLSGCNIFLSKNEIVIRPFIPPTLDFSPFSNVRQRIYMSATLGKSGELERAFGVSSIKRLPMVKDWENRTIGRRFFMFPLASFKNNQISEIILKTISKVDKTLLIVNDDRTQEIFKKFISENSSKEIFTARDIEKSKKDFIDSKNAVAIVSNRFDGIDFPGDECRLQILFDLQMATHIQEKFLTSRMCSQVLFMERINTRLIQALGRCTRSNTDYAAICVVGEELMNTLISPKKIIQFNPELQAELNFGFQNSTNYDDINEYLELLDTFLYDREDWEAAEKNIISERDKIIDNTAVIDETPYNQLYESSVHEVTVQYYMWKENFIEAFKICTKICNTLKHDSLKGYLGFWYYLSAYCAFNIYRAGDVAYKKVYGDLLSKASETTLSIKWFNKLADRNNEINDFGMESIIERMERFFLRKKSKNSNTKLLEELDLIYEEIKAAGGKKFESAHESLGKWLGYKTLNPSGDSEPDTIWILNSQFCIISEAKIYENNSKSIPTRHVREADGHYNWVKGHYTDERIGLVENFDHITVFITNASSIEASAAIQGERIFYVNRALFAKWAKICVNSLKDLVVTFSIPGDVVWRDKAVKIITENRITPSDYIEMIKKKTLSQL